MLCRLRCCGAALTSFPPTPAHYQPPPPAASAGGWDVALVAFGTTASSRAVFTIHRRRPVQGLVRVLKIAPHHASLRST